MYSDPIADMLTRLRNAYMARKTAITVPYSQIKHDLAKILESKGYVSKVATSKEDGHKTLLIELEEIANPSLRPTFKRISKPGRRVYVKVKELKPVNSGFGIGVLSTPKGVMTSYEAYAQGLGGEYVCQVY